MDTLEFIMELEGGESLTAEEYVDGMASLVQSGMAWKLQGFYGRLANDLIEAGHISPEGEVLSYPEDA